jgi:hypothetical protein
MSTALQLQRVERAAGALARIDNIEDLQTLAQIFVKSGFFQDAKDAAQAIVKVMAGAELGFPAIASMTGIYIVKGKVSMSANLMAAAIKRSGKYNFRVRQLDSQAAEIEFFEDNRSIGVSRFTMVEAKGANLADSPTWQKFPRNMLYARAMSNGAKWFCPDIFGGPVYTPDELGMRTDEEGEAIEVRPEPVAALPEPEVVDPNWEPEPERPVRLEGAQPTDARPRTLGDLVTPKQLWMIRSTGRESGVDVEAECQKQYRCSLEEISKKAASHLIEYLKEKVEPKPEAMPSDELRALNRQLGYSEAQLLKWLSEKFGFSKGLSLQTALGSLNPGEMSQCIDLFKQKLEEK